MSARDAGRRAHRKVWPATIHIVAGQDHSELPVAPPLDYARPSGQPRPELGRVSGPFPKDYADEELPAAARPMFDTLSKILLGSILALALTALAFGFSLGG